MGKHKRYITKYCDCNFRFYFEYFEKLKRWHRKRRDKILSTICNKYYIDTVVLAGHDWQNKESESLPGTYLQKFNNMGIRPTSIYRIIYREILYFGTGQCSTHFDQPVIVLLFIFHHLFIAIRYIYLLRYNTLKIKECV